VKAFSFEYIGIFFLVLANPVVTAGDASAISSPSDCTLQPTEGSKQAVLSNGVLAKTTWTACQSIRQDFIFKWPAKRGIPVAPGQALERAGALLKEWRKTAKPAMAAEGEINYGSGDSPFGDLATAIARRAADSRPYVYAEEFAVTPENRGWDGAWVSLSSTTETVEITLHYWANP
jgi:hypothetical protein